MRTLVIFFCIYCFLISANTQGETGPGVELVGTLTQGSLLTGKVAQGVSVLLNDKPVAVTPAGDFVIGFGRDAELTQVIRLQRNGKDIAEQKLVLEQRVYNIQRIEGVPQQMVTPDPDKAARIKNDTRLVKSARQKTLERYDFLQNFIVPLKGPVTGVYGSQRVYNGTPKRPHYGVDYAAPVGTLVYAPANGLVTLAHDDMYYSGGTLIVDHGYGVSSTFIHLSEVLVKEGDSVIQGDPIARVGKGGRATGPHLDWRMNWYQVRLDPQLVLKRYE